MSEIGHLLFEANKETMLKTFELFVNAYETNPLFRTKRFYDGDVLTGYCVTMDRDGMRILSEAHYIGNNKMMAVKMWKWMTQGARVMQVSVMRTNTKIIDFFKRSDFKIIDDSQPLNIIFKCG